MIVLALLLSRSGVQLREEPAQPQGLPVFLGVR